MTTQIGIDVGGTNLRVGLIKAGEVINETRFKANFSNICKDNTAPLAYQLIIDHLANAISSIIQNHADQSSETHLEVTSVGIGFPGFIDPITHNILQSPNLPGLFNVSLSADLAKCINLPVIVENDALAAAYGEYTKLNETGLSLIYIGLGTGVGGGLIVNGKPFTGQFGMAMEIGHLTTVQNGRLCGCGKLGCMEQYASASGVTLNYAHLTGVTLTADAIALLAQSGDEHAAKAYAIAGENLAVALAHIITVLDIRRVVIGGGLSQAWHLISLSFNAKLSSMLIPLVVNSIQITIAENNDQAGMTGAAMLSTITQ